MINRILCFIFNHKWPVNNKKAIHWNPDGEHDGEIAMIEVSRRCYTCDKYEVVHSTTYRDYHAPNLTYKEHCEYIKEVFKNTRGYEHE